MIVILKAELVGDDEAIESARYPISRDCPRCRPSGCRGSVIGHGRRQRVALDTHRCGVLIRRGLCRACGGTITFLPPSLRPYRRYALGVIATAVRERLRGTVFGQIEIALHDLDAIPDVSTLRRWSRDFPRPPTIVAS